MTNDLVDSLYIIIMFCHDYGAMGPSNVSTHGWWIDDVDSGMDYWTTDLNLGNLDLP